MARDLRMAQDSLTRKNYVVRQATLADQPDLIEMARHFIESTPYGKLLTFDRAAVENLMITVFAHGVIFVGESLQAHRLVGMIALAAFPHPIAGVTYGDEICWWVEPEHRLGLGRALLYAAEEWTGQNGLAMLKMVAPANSTIGRFYEAHGYEPLETAYVKRF